MRASNITRTRLFKYIENFTTKKGFFFFIKNSDIFHISVQNIDCVYSLEPPRRGGSNEYPQSMFLSRNKKNNVYPCKPQFYYIKVGFKGVKIIKACFRDVYAKVAYPNPVEHVVSFAKPFMVLDCLYVNGLFWNRLV